MADLPVMLNVRGKLAVVVGGGGAARRRVASLVECGARVVVVAPEVDTEIERMGVEVHRRAYRAGDVEGAFLVVVATDDREVNEAVSREAASGRVLMNRADDGVEGDVAVMAHGRCGPVTVAVSTGRISAAAAAAIRDELLAGVDARWVTMLETVAPFRADARAIADGARRQATLRRLTDAEARRVLDAGGVGALAAHCRKIIDEAQR